MKFLICQYPKFTQTAGDVCSKVLIEVDIPSMRIGSQLQERGDSHARSDDTRSYGQRHSMQWEIDKQYLTVRPVLCCINRRANQLSVHDRLGDAKNPDMQAVVKLSKYTTCLSRYVIDARLILRVLRTWAITQYILTRWDNKFTTHQHRDIDH